MSNDDFAKDAMCLPDLAWQEGKTAGEISLLQFVLRTRNMLKASYSDGSDYDVKEELALLLEAAHLLQCYGVESGLSIPKTTNNCRCMVAPCPHTLRKE
jgi:hypothetical protein